MMIATNKQVRQCSMARLLQLLRFRPRTALPALTALRMESQSPFLVRYQANKSSGGMRKHKDNAHISYIINLSKRGSFAGGGTHIYALNRTIGSGQGQSVVFPSQVLHSGVGITRGERYILSGFASLTKEYIVQKRLLSYGTSFMAF